MCCQNRLWLHCWLPIKGFILSNSLVIKRIFKAVYINTKKVMLHHGLDKYHWRTLQHWATMFGCTSSLHMQHCCIILKKVAVEIMYWTDYGRLYMSTVHASTRASIPPLTSTAMLRPLSFCLPPPSAPSPIFNEDPGITPGENFGIKDACRWVLEH